MLFGPTGVGKTELGKKFVCGIGTTYREKVWGSVDCIE